MPQQLQHWIVLWMTCSLLVLTGCTQTTPDDPIATDAGTPTPVAVQPVSAIDTTTLPQLQGTATVELTVKGETITIALDGTQAPVTAGNFVDLVQRGFYDGLAFHRVVREPEPFVVQGGDPQSKDPNFPPQQLGTGSFVDPNTGQPRYIPLEIAPAGGEPLYGKTFQEAGVTVAPALPHRRGAVAMARSGMPNSASSQFYITLADVPFLDGNYAVMGYVTAGMDVVDTIQRGDAITAARVVAGAENLVVPSTPNP